MSLPKVALPTGSVVVGGETVEFHSLTRHQALRLNEFQGREDEAEDFMLACALDVTEDEARAWRDSVDMETGGVLIDAIIELSGLTEKEKAQEEA